MKYGTSFIFPYIPPINPFGLKRRFPEAFTYRQRLCIALPCMQFIPLRPYLPNDRYQDFPFFFFAHEYAFIPFSHSTHSNLHTLFPMQQRKQPCRTWFHEHFTEVLSKSFSLPWRALSIRGLQAPPTALRKRLFSLS